MRFSSWWIKFLLVAVNVIFLVSGITFLALGNKLAVMDTLDRAYQIYFVDEHSVMGPLALTLMSSLLIVGAVLNSLSVALKRNNYVFWTSCLFFVALLFELLIGVSASMYRKNEIAQNMHSAKWKFNVTGQGRATDKWNMMQQQIHCCGVDGYNDWAKTPFSQGKHIPDSCCKEYTVGCGLNRIPDTEETVWHLGCAAELSKIVTPKMNILVAICFGMAFLKMIHIVLLIFLCKIKKTESRSDEDMELGLRGMYSRNCDPVETLV